MPNLILDDIEYSNIQNIIFDLGGVIMNIDYQKVISALKKIGINNFDTFYTQLGQIELFDNYDKGLISPAEFRNGIRKVSGIEIGDNAFNDAWNLMLVDIPKERIQLLNNLKQQFKIYLLSNTNEIHLEYLFKYMHRTFQLENLDPLFHKTYYSCRVHMRKPNTDIYLHVIDDSKLIASETLFIDDFQLNIDAAENVGIVGYCLKEEKTITSLFINYL